MPPSRGLLKIRFNQQHGEFRPLWVGFWPTFMRFLQVVSHAPWRVVFWFITWILWQGKLVWVSFVSYLDVVIMCRVNISEVLSDCLQQILTGERVSLKINILVSAQGTCTCSLKGIGPKTVCKQNRNFNAECKTR